MASLELPEGWTSTEVFPSPSSIQNKNDPHENYKMSFDFELDEDKIKQVIESVTEEINNNKYPFGHQKTAFLSNKNFFSMSTKVGSTKVKNRVSGRHVKNALRDKIPGLNEHAECPVDDKYSCNTLNDMLSSVIIHLNDAHRWTREEIADWLDTLDIDLRFNLE